MEQVNHYGFSIKVEAVLTQLLQRYTKIEFVTLFIGGRKNSKVACLGSGFEPRIFLEHKCYGFIEKGGTVLLLPKTKTGNYEETRG